MGQLISKSIVHLTKKEVIHTLKIIRGQLLLWAHYVLK